MQELSIHLTGWIAMILILLSYLLITTGKIDAHTRLYQGLNFVGSSCFIYHLYNKQAWPAMWLNIIWAAIALITLIGILRKKN